MSKEFTVEKDWTCKAGYRCVVLALSTGHRCGYVGIGPFHPLYGVHYGKSSEALTDMASKMMKRSLGKQGIISIFCAVISGEYNRPDVVFDVHGSLTYSSFGPLYPVPSINTFWYGFDCAHDGDGKDHSIMDKRHLELEARFPSSMGVVRTLQYVIDECESLASQLKELDDPSLLFV